MRDPTEDDKLAGPGLGRSASVGKDWFVSAQWSLGVNRQLYLARVEANGAVGASLRFAATYN